MKMTEAQNKARSAWCRHKQWERFNPKRQGVGQMTGILWFDCDGVLADFAGHFRAVYGHEPSGAREPLRGAFYDSLPLLPGAKRMIAETYGLRPFCLTHLPSEQGEAYLKRQWLDRHFPGLPVVEAEFKAAYCRPGDCLVDDSERHRAPWLKAGGTFLLHSDPVETLRQIRDWQGDGFTESERRDARARQAIESMPSNGGGGWYPPSALKG